MTKYLLTKPGGPWDFPALGFSAVDGAILDGDLPVAGTFTSAPGPEWSTTTGTESGINRYAPPSTLITYTPQPVAQGLVDSVGASLFAPGSPAQVALSAAFAPVGQGLLKGAALAEKLRGGNLVPKPGTNGWNSLFAEWDWTNWIKPQVDRALALGLNAVRLIGGPEVVNYTVDGIPAIGQATYNARWSQLAAYCESKGIYLYPCLIGARDITNQSLSWQDGPTTIAVQSSAVALARFPNVFAFDIFQEGGLAGITTADVLAMFAAVRAVAPTIPLTCSHNSASGFIDTGSIPYLAAVAAGGSDFIDLHIYVDGLAPDDIDQYVSQFPGRSVLIGEFGAPQSMSTAAQTARFAAMVPVHNRAGVRGSFIWGLADQKTADPANQWGVWDNTGFVQGSAPLSTTVGKRTNMTDQLPPFAKTQLVRPYASENLLPPATARGVQSQFLWLTGGGNTTRAADPRGIAMTATATGTTQVSSTPRVAVIPSLYYQVYARFLAGATARSVSVSIDWYDGAGAFISTSTETGRDSATRPVGLTRVAQAPANAATANITARVTDATQAAGETHYVKAWLGPYSTSEQPAAPGTDLATFAPLASPAFTGSPQVPTQGAGDNTTKAASTAYTDAAVLVERNRAIAAEAGLGSSGPLKTGHCFTGNPAQIPWAATAWPAANRMVFARVYGSKGAPTKFRLLVGTSSGNIRIVSCGNTGSGVTAAPSGAFVNDTGVIACPAAGLQTVTIPTPVAVNDGDWIGLWVDNTTATIQKFSGASNSVVTAGLVAAMAATSGTTAPASLFAAAECYYLAVE